VGSWSRRDSIAFEKAFSIAETGKLENDMEDMIEMADFFRRLEGEAKEIIVVQIVGNSSRTISGKTLKHRNGMKNEKGSFGFISNGL